MLYDVIRGRGAPSRRRETARTPRLYFIIISELCNIFVSRSEKLEENCPLRRAAETEKIAAGRDSPRRRRRVKKSRASKMMPVYTLSGLPCINRESKDAIRSAVNELGQAGYIERRQTTDACGRMDRRPLNHTEEIYRKRRNSTTSSLTT